MARATSSPSSHKPGESEQRPPESERKIVTIARFIEGLRQANGIVAGLAGMPWCRFLVFNALGAALWVAGNNLTAIYEQLSRYELYLLVALAALVAILIGRWWWRRHRARGAT